MVHSGEAWLQATAQSRFQVSAREHTQHAFTSTCTCSSCCDCLSSIGICYVTAAISQARLCTCQLQQCTHSLVHSHPPDATRACPRMHALCRWYLSLQELPDAAAPLGVDYPVGWAYVMNRAAAYTALGGWSLCTHTHTCTWLAMCRSTRL